MAEAQQIQVQPGQVPPMPAGAVPAGAPSTPAVPSAAQQAPGFVNPAAAQYSAADVERMVAERLAAAQGAAQPAAPAQPATAPSNTPTEITSSANDALLNAYTESFSALGGNIDIERAIGNALKFGKPELIDTKYIAEVGGEHAARLVTIGKSIVEHVQTKTNEGVQASYSAAGGQEQWNAASAAFQTNAPEHLKQVIVEMLNSGSTDKVKAAAKMVVEFAGSNGYVAQAPGMVHAGTAGGNPSSALSKEEFQAGLQRLNRTAPDYGAQREALFKARALGKQLGR